MNLKDAFDQDKFVIDGGQYTDEDFKAMSLDDLHAFKMRINKKINGLSSAIAEKKIDYANGGEGASKDWYMRHRSALSINQRVLTYVNYIIKKRHRSDRKIGDYFMAEAKQYLSPPVFDRILTKAHLEMETKKEKDGSGL